MDGGWRHLVSLRLSGSLLECGGTDEFDENGCIVEERTAERGEAVREERWKKPDRSLNDQLVLRTEALSEV